MNPTQPQQYPFPFIVPWQGNNNVNQNLLDNDAPARVRIAMEFLNNLAMKTMTRCAVNDLSIEWKDGPDLTANEKSAQGAACSMLIDYFAGKMKPDEWERLRQKAAQNGVVPSKSPGQLLRCPACAPEGGNPDCEICSGSGRVMIYPVGN